MYINVQYVFDSLFYILSGVHQTLQFVANTVKMRAIKLVTFLKSQ
jgi:hypothetical protein